MSFLQSVTVLCVFLLNYSYITEENVIVTEDATCWEGRSHTLTCKFEKFISVIVWMNGNDGNTIVHCYRNGCSLNPAYVGIYNFSRDQSQHTLNLILRNVSKNDDGRKFVCSDGTNSDCKVLNVGDYEQGLEDTENGIITASSACSQELVSFKWIRIDASNYKKEEFKPNILNQTKTPCSNECDKYQHKRYSETISVVPSDNGTKYYLEVIAFYGTKSVKSTQTTVANRIKEQKAADTKGVESEDSNVNFVIVTTTFVTAVVIVTAIVTVAVICLRKRVKKADTSKEKEDDEKEDECSNSDMTQEGKGLLKQGKEVVSNQTEATTQGDDKAVVDIPLHFETTGSLLPTPNMS